MSRKTSFVANVVAAERKSRGSHLTHESREKLLREFSRVVHAKGFTHVVEIKDITEKHIKSFVAEKIDSGLGKRTLQNYMAALRTVLREGGKETFAKSERISNHTLGIGGASRAGTKESCPEEVYSAAMSKITDEGVKSALSLMPTIGLRDEEAIRSVKSLATWERQLADGKNYVTVVYGTKGGRPREAYIPDRVQAMAAVRSALRCAKENGGGSIIDRPTLAQAKATLSSKAATAGLKGLHSPHSLRYAYANAVEKSFLSQGYSYAESIALTSQSLGHGDGRGRYVHRVYCQKSDDSET